MSKNAAIYLRVSTSDQDYERQRNELLVLAKGLGYSVAPEHIFEEKKSAVISADSREELSRMRELTKANVERIFIWDITRLSRKANDFITIINEFTQKGICLHFKDKNIITLDDDGKENILTQMYLYILGVFAQLDAENLKAKFRSGKREGYRNGTSHTPIAPFGYRMENKKLVIEEDNAEWVRYIYESYTTGKSLTEVVNTLNAQKVASKRGKKWTKVALGVVLRNPTYKGKAVVTLKYKNDKNEVISTEDIVTSCPAIIDEALWEKAQKQRDMNRHDVDKTKVTEAYLRGIIKCGNCGCSYVVLDSSKYKIKQYVCGDKMRGTNTRVYCTNGGIKVDTVDALVWLCIKDVYTYNRFQDSFAAEKAENQERYNNNINVITGLKEELEELEKRKKKINKGWLNDVYTEAEARELRMEVESSMNMIINQIAMLEGENLNLSAKLNLDFSQYKLPEKELTFAEKKVVYNDLIESCRMYAYGKCDRVVQVKLKVGVVYNIVIHSAREINYYIIEDSIARFNPDSLKDGKELFTLDDQKKVVIKDGTTGTFDWNEMWNLMDKHNLIMKM